MNQKQKNIWIVDPYINANVGSARQEIIARYLEQNGYKVVVICSDAGVNFDFKNKKCLFVKKQEVNYLLINIDMYNVGGIKRVLAQIKFQCLILRYAIRYLGSPDLIINNFAGIFGDFAFFYKRRYGTKILLDILDFWPEVLVDLGYLKPNNVLTKYLYYREYKSYCKCDSLFFSMQGGKDYIKEKKWNIENGKKVDLSKVHYMNNGIDLKMVDYNLLHYISENDYFEDDKFIVGYIGAIGVPNDIELLVETAKLAYEKNINDIMFYVYGIGGELDKVKRLAQKYQLDNIKFKGYLDKKYFPSTINKCNLAILNFKETPTLRFGLSNNKFFMYCASGIPVLSTVCPRYSLIEKYKCGMIVQHDAESVLEGVIKFKTMKKEQIDYYKKNARKVGELYDYSVLFKILLKEIETLL